ncbi:leucyl aminopeptidase [Chromobacterium violaceum]|uniref:leucyl aminopeptidase n=1 Tax=Chromobacterium violaceum TaxID=536 RepID=UPI000C12932C|nr:leucyl aminopeptidase [Chromobacterium violaceum]ATP28728.1 leucyl aminopeptidase [Chromobacterium violaceum]ATP32638.1 leucyl aminopeptidase [Chromobacterium violaceum]QIY81596.1 leucyl aminopeptidase [Chromobacterium violaceum]
MRITTEERARSVRNMYACLALHPAVRDKAASGEPIRLLLGFDAFHGEVAADIAEGAGESMAADIRLAELECESADALTAAIEQCDVFIFLYRSSTLPSVDPRGPAFLLPIKHAMQSHWKKSILFKDYGTYFYEAFSEPRARMAERNRRLIALAEQAGYVAFEQEGGGWLRGSIRPDQSWTSIDGDGNVDLVPGEIATSLPDLQGEVRFSGAFLSTIPFAAKYGVVRDFATLRIRDGRVADFSCGDTRFSADFDKYLSANPGNAAVAEFGIGTNCGVKGLYGLNAGFEERHPGLHLGLGGGELGSHHLDLIFSGGRLRFGDKVFFDGGFSI